MLQPSSPLPRTPSPKFGPTIPLAIFRDPVRAFAMIAQSREWLPAYLLLVLLGFAEVYLYGPALAHLAQVRALTEGSSPAEVRRVVAGAFEFQVLWEVLGPFVLWGFVAVLLAAAAIPTRGLPGVVVYFSLCMNCALPAEIGQLIVAAGTRLRAPTSFHTPSDVATVLPISLAAFRPHGSPAEIAFLSYWDAFTLWSLVLLGCGYAAISNMRLVPALLLVLGVGVALALTQVAGGP